MDRSRKFHQGGPDLFFFFSNRNIFQRALRTSLEKQLDPIGPIASQGRSVPVFLRKPIATCDFPGGVRPPAPHHSGSTHEMNASYDAIVTKQDLIRKE